MKMASSIDSYVTERYLMERWLTSSRETEQEDPEYETATETDEASQDPVDWWETIPVERVEGPEIEMEM